MARQEGPAVPAPSMVEPIGDFDVVSADEWNTVREKLLVEGKGFDESQGSLGGQPQTPSRNRS
jgi:hypothetical protein